MIFRSARIQVKGLILSRSAVHTKEATMSQTKTKDTKASRTLWPVCKGCRTELRTLDALKIYIGTATVKPKGEAFRVTDNKDEREDRDFETDYFCPECGELVHLIPAEEEERHNGHRTTIRIQG
jgi:hypothetical protein